MDSEEIFRTIFNDSADGILIAEKETKTFIMSNDTICNMLGYTKEEFAGLSVKDIHPEADLPYVIEQFEKQSRGEFIVAENLPVMRKDGTVFHADIRSKTIILLGNEYLVGVFIDVTERNKAETMLQEEKYRAQKYLNIAGVMLVTLNLNGKITLINKKGCEVLDYSKDEVLNKNWFELCIHEDIREEIWAVFNKLILGEIEPVEYYENTVIRKDGEPRLIAFHNTLIRNAESQITDVLFSGEDITNRKKAEDELKSHTEELEKLNKAFVGRELKMIELKKEIEELKKIQKS